MNVSISTIATELEPHIRDLESIACDTDRSAEAHALYAIADEFRLALGLRPRGPDPRLVSAAEHYRRVMAAAHEFLTEPATRAALEYLRLNGS